MMGGEYPKSIGWQISSGEYPGGEYPGGGNESLNEIDPRFIKYHPERQPRGI